MVQEGRDRRATCLGSTVTAAALTGLTLYRVGGGALRALRCAHWHGVPSPVLYWVIEMSVTLLTELLADS